MMNKHISVEAFTAHSRESSDSEDDGFSPMRKDNIEEIELFD
jgi:hypothetical protein